MQSTVVITNRSNLLFIMRSKKEWNPQFYNKPLNSWNKLRRLWCCRVDFWTDSRTKFKCIFYNTWHLTAFISDSFGNYYPSSFIFLTFKLSFNLIWDKANKRKDFQFGHNEFFKELAHTRDKDSRSEFWFMVNAIFGNA